MTRFPKTCAILASTALISAASLAPASAAWRGHGYHGGHGGAVAAGVLGALAIGAIAASAAANAAPTNCVIEKRPVYNAYGHYVGAKRIRVCD